MINDATTLSENIRIYSDKQAAELLGVSQQTLWRMRRAKEISFRRVYGQIRYTHDDILEYLERAKRQAVAA